LKRLLYWLPAFFWAGLIFYFSSQSSPPGAVHVPDSVGHYFAYLILALCCALGFAGRIPIQQAPSVYLSSWVAATLYGVSDEWHQMFTPARTPTWEDVLVDALGALCGVALLAVIGVVWRRRQQEHES